MFIKYRDMRSAIKIWETRIPSNVDIRDHHALPTPSVINKERALFNYAIYNSRPKSVIDNLEMDIKACSYTTIMACAI
jgi:hypothetical protein